MKTLIFILIFPIFCFSQDLEIRNLVKVIIADTKPKDYKFINLTDSSFAIDSFELDYALDEAKDNREDSLYSILKKNFTKKSFEETKTINWQNFNLESVKIVQKNSFQFPCNLKMDRMNVVVKKLKSKFSFCEKNCEFTIKKRMFWSRKKTENEIRKFWADYDKKNPIENSGYFKYSTPVFSTGRTYAIVQTYQNSKYGSEDLLVLYKKDEKTWKRMLVLREIYRHIGVVPSPCN